jgi:hypothetical protein
VDADTIRSRKLPITAWLPSPSRSSSTPCWCPTPNR